MNIRESWNKLTWKKVLIIGSTTLVAASVVAPISIYVAKNINPAPLQRFEYDGKVFNSRAEMFAYAKSVATVETQTIRSRDRWSIQYNNKLITFNNITDLNDFVSKNIITHEAVSSKQFELGGTGEIDSKDLADLNIAAFNGSASKEMQVIDIYRGKNNTFYTSDTEAKDSYLQIHDIYLFDNIFFRTKEELSVYLYKYYDDINNDGDNIVILAPGGAASQPVNLNLITEQNTKDYIQQFVTTNAKEFLEIKTTENNQPAYKYFDKQDIYGQEAIAAFDFNDVSYVDITSNQGKPNFIVDSHVSDEYELFGPYYTKSSESLKKITDNNMWHKMEGTDLGFVNNQYETQLFSSFLNNIVGERDSEENWVYPFNFGKASDVNDKYRKLIITYFQNLRNAFPKVYNSVINLYNQMKSGKRYSSFYKLPILFIHTLEQLIFYGSDQNIIEETREFYIAVAEYYDIRIKSFVPPVFLKNNEKENEVFSLVEVFGFKKYNLDLNVDVEAYMDVISREYQDLMKFARYFSHILSITINAIDIIDFNIEYIDRLFNTNFRHDSPEKIEGYRLLWNMQSNTDRDEVEQIIKSVIVSNKIEVDQEIIDDLLVKYVLPKQIAIKNITDSIKRDYDILKNIEIFRPEHLTRLPDTSFFNQISPTNVQILVKVIKNNNSVIDYKTLGLLKLIATSSMKFSLSPYVNSLYSDELNKQLNAVFSSESELAINKIIKRLQSMYGVSVLINSYYLPKDGYKDFDGWTMDSAITLLENMFSIVKDTADMFDAVIGLVGDLASMFSFIPFVSIGITILTNLFSSEKYSYVFESEDAKYIWNGGKTNSWLFGIIEDKVSDIGALKMVPPMQVTRQHIESGKYYNSKIYDLEDDIKKAQMQDALNNRFSSKSMRTVYSFKEKINTSINQPSKDCYGAIGNLNDEKKDDLVDIVYDKIERKEISTTKNVYSYANGITFDKTTASDMNIKNIINTIQTTKVATIPNIVDGYPVTAGGTEEDFSVPVYQIPGTSWSAAAGFSVNNTAIKYIIVDPNVVEGEVPPSNKQVIDKIKTSFYNSFNVYSKKIIDVDKNKYPKFTDYNTNVQRMNVYEALLPNGYRKVFLDRSDAFTWLLSQLDFLVYDSFITTEEYTLNDLKFNTLSEYLEWVMSNAKEL